MYVFVCACVIVWLKTTRPHRCRCDFLYCYWPRRRSTRPSRSDDRGIGSPKSQDRNHRRHSRFCRQRSRFANRQLTRRLLAPMSAWEYCPFHLDDHQVVGWSLLNRQLDRFRCLRRPNQWDGGSVVVLSTVVKWVAMSMRRMKTSCDGLGWGTVEKHEHMQIIHIIYCHKGVMPKTLIVENVVLVNQAKTKG